MSPRFQGLETVKLLVRGPGRVDSRKELDKLIADFAPGQGWVNYQSAVHVLDGTNTPPCVHPQDGFLLAAEFCAGNATLSIRHRASQQGGAWQVTRLEEGRGEEHGYDAYTYLSVAHGLLRYRRYWRLASDGVRPFAYRLTKIGGAAS